MKTVTKPLYHILNEQRTQGDWTISGICDTSLIVGTPPDNYIDILCTTPGHSIKAFDKLPENESERVANAKYTALAVNNLSHIAEALEEFTKIDITKYIHTDLEEGRELHWLVSKAKEALQHIS